MNIVAISIKNKIQNIGIVSNWFIGQKIFLAIRWLTEGLVKAKTIHIYYKIILVIIKLINRAINSCSEERVILGI